MEVYSCEKPLNSRIFLVSILLLANSALRAARQFLMLKQSKNFNNRIINFFYSTLLHLPKPFFDTRKIGELVALLNYTSRIQRVITTVAGSFIIDCLVSITSISFLSIYSWQSAMIAILSLPFYFLLVYRFNKRIINAQKNVMASYALSESNYISIINGIESIKNTNKQSFFTNLNKEIYGNFQDKIFSLGKINICLSLLSGIASVLFKPALFMNNTG